MMQSVRVRFCVPTLRDFRTEARTVLGTNCCETWGKGVHVVKQVWGWLYGVVVSPSETFRHLAREKPVGVAVLLLLVLAILTSAVGSADVVQRLLDMLNIETSHRWMIAGEMIGHFVGTVMAIVVLYVVSARFRGSGDFAGMFSAVAFARFPALFSVPVDLLSRVLGAAPGGNPISTGVGIWTLILTVIALRESRGLQTGESILVFVVAFVALAVVGGLVMATVLL